MRSARALFLLPALLGLGACTKVGSGGDEFRDADGRRDVVAPERVARRIIQTTEVRRQIGFLASDQMRGRDTPSPELERAASWIAERFAAAGLEPAGQDRGFIHFWPYGQTVPEEDGTTPVRAAAGPDTAGQVPNVVGIRAGSDAARAGEYVIVIAHFDHVGVGPPTADGDSIYNGADDNASGTAALVQVAQAFGALPNRTVRPLLFLATSGNEKGLLGARWFAADPTVFLSEAVAVLNIDRVGRNSPGTVGVVGHDYSSLGPLLVRTAARHHRLTVDPDPAPGEDLFTRSDHYPFARRGIPAISITSGLHEEDPSADDEPGRVDPDKVTRVARLVFLAAYELAMGAEAVWTEEGRAAVRDR